jgi:SAM-dependent methyltransferase
VPWHAANTLSKGEEDAIEEHFFAMYSPLVGPRDTLVDLGCGTGGLVRRFAPVVARAIGVDASEEMIAPSRASAPPHAEFVTGSVVRPPLPPGTADLAVSRQVMEHLHPDDVPAHLAAVREMLRPRGRFLIETPQGLTGPWDISRGLSETPTGFHLREYTHRELAAMLRDAGFTSVRARLVPATVLARLGPLRRWMWIPVGPKGAAERLAERLPPRRRDQVVKASLASLVVLLAARA